MLARARAKGAPGVRWASGVGVAIPAPDAAFDIVFLSMVYHHLPDPIAAGREWRRVLSAGGRVMIRNTTSDVRFSWDAFFPNFRTVMAARTPSRTALLAAMAQAGFALIAQEMVEQVIAPDWRTLAANAALKADSNLLQLSDTDFEIGMAALNAYALTEPPEPVLNDVDFFVFEAAR